MKDIYDILRKCESVYGARPRGVGYRGAVIGLIKPAYKKQIKSKTAEEYPRKHPGYKDMYAVNFCKTAEGAGLVKYLEAMI